MDPCVLAARAEPARGELAFDPARYSIVVRSGDTNEHVAIGTLRLELVAGTMTNGPVILSPVIDLAREIEPQLSSVRCVSALLHNGRIEPEPDLRFPRLVEALRALDARAAGASHRDIGLQLLGGSDWPGDGEYLKSRARRLAVMAEALRLAGPAGVLAHRI